MENNNNWTFFHFASGSNPYIAKTEKEKERILKKYNCLFIEEEKNNYFILDNLFLDNYDVLEYPIYNKNIIDEVDDILTLYTDDEAGETQKQKYKEMTNTQKINLFYNALYYSESIRDFDTFRTDVIINFDYNNY